MNKQSRQKIRDASCQRAACAAAALALLAGTIPPVWSQVSDPPRSAPSGGVNLSFHNADAADVLRAFSLHSGISVAVSPAVKGKIISIRLKNVSVEEALTLITQAAGVSYRKAGKAYVVGTAEELKGSKAPDSSSTYALKHITPAAAKAFIEGALPDTGVQIAPGTNSIMIRGDEADVRQAQRLLLFADLPVVPVSDVVTPKYVAPAFLADVIRQALTGVTVEVKENALIVTGPQATVARLKDVVAAVDTQAGASQRVEIYRIRFSSAASLAAMLTAAIPGLQATPSAEPYAPLPARFQPLTGASFGSGSGDVSGGAVGAGVGVGGQMAGAQSAGIPAGVGGNGVSVSAIKSRQLILVGPDAQVEQALRLLKAIDVAPAQVVIEARIMDLSTENALDFGILWGTTQVQAGQGSGGAAAQEIFVQGAAGVKVQELNVPDMIRFGRFRRSPLDFAAQLRLLESKGQGKTLANPRITTIDNEDANIFIGDILRFQRLAFSSAVTGNAFTVQEVPVGIALLVRPRVNEEGDITIKVHPVVSTLTSISQDGLPQTASREADTTLRVRDGETITIGGLLRDQDIQTVQQVPILGNIPFFGELFKSRNRRKQRSEVVIFLTIRLFKDGEPEPVIATPPGMPVPTPAAPGTGPKEKR